MRGVDCDGSNCLMSKECREPTEYLTEKYSVLRTTGTRDATELWRVPRQGGPIRYSMMEYDTTVEARTY